MPELMIELLPEGQRELYERVVARLDGERQFLDSHELTVLS